MSQRPRHPVQLLAACSALALLGLGCGAAFDDIKLTPESQDWTIHWGQTFAETDEDADGLPDEGEDWLAEKFAPELRLPPDHEDWTRPANVDWYLPHVHMRFDHPNCPDHEVLGIGTVSQDRLSEQTHARASGVGVCSHTEELVSSATSDKGFFLQPPDDAVHNGSTNPSDWRTYVHVKASQRVPGAVDLQYWFFYPYNDWVATVNHEADWEHVTIVVTGEGELKGAWYANHNGGEWLAPSKLTLTSDGRPVVFVADGSHASYATVGEFSHGPGFTDRTFADGPVWRTWENWVNVGERDAIRNGQTFLRYGGRWGEVGQTDFTSGPQGPAFQDAWDAL